MKIIEITGEPILHGGQERFIEGILSLAGNGTHIDVLTPYDCDNELFIQKTEANSGRVFQLQMDFAPGQSRRGLLKPLTAFLKEHSYEIAHIHSGSISAMAYAALAAKAAGIPHIIVHAHSTGFGSLKQQIIRFLFGILMKYCVTDYLACSPEAGKSKFLPLLTEKKLKVIPNGIDIRSFCRDDTVRKEMRETLKIRDNVFVLGHVGRFTSEKNHEFLVELLEAVIGIIPDTKLLLVGDGERREQIEELVHRKGLDERVVFTGNVDPVQDYYQVMDVFLLPSVYEGFPFVAVEAQAAGLPCIFSNGVTESAVMGKHVIRMDLADPKAWVQQCIRFRSMELADNTESIRTAGYDLKGTIGQIRRVYGIQHAEG